MTQIETRRLRLTHVTRADAPALSTYYTRNAKHLAPWEPLRPEGFHDLDAWQTRAAAHAENGRKGTSYHYVARPLDGDDIIAICNFNAVARGAFQACFLGYSIDAGEEGKGVMQEALEALIPHVFVEHDLHRIMANYMPRNRRSGQLLERLGFEEEGRARAYLKIAGRWEDHILTARIRD